MDNLLLDTVADDARTSSLRFRQPECVKQETNPSDGRVGGRIALR